MMKPSLPPPSNQYMARMRDGRTTFPPAFESSGEGKTVVALNGGGVHAYVGSYGAPLGPKVLSNLQHRQTALPVARRAARAVQSVRAIPGRRARRRVWRLLGNIGVLLCAAAQERESPLSSLSPHAFASPHPPPHIRRPSRNWGQGTRMRSFSMRGGIQTHQPTRGTSWANSTSRPSANRRRTAALA